MLKITTSKQGINQLFASTSSTDMFFNGSVNPICRDVEKDPWFTEFLKGKFRAISHGNGGFSQDYGIVEDTLHIGGAGNGWNAIAPRDCEIKQGELCKDFRIEGKNVDFWNSHVVLSKMMDAKNYIIANMLKGDLEQLFRQIRAIPEQKTLYIQMCEETGPAEWGDGMKYATKCYEWQEAVQKEFPGQDFHFIFDIPTYWSKEKGISEKAKAWGEQIASVKPIDKKTWGIRQYCHGFNMWELTGDIEEDVKQIDYAAKELLPAFSKSILSSPFFECKVFLGQVSTNEGAYTPQVTKGKQYLVNFYLRMTKHWIEQARDEGVNYIGQCYIGMNSWINQKLTSNLDFQYVSVINNLFDQGLKALTISEFDPEVDILGGIKDNVVRLVMQNRKGVAVQLPDEMEVDGVKYPFKPSKSIGRSCTSIDSTTSMEFTPEESLAPYCIVYLEIPA